MYYSYIKIEYVATSFSPARTDLALKLLKLRLQSDSQSTSEDHVYHVDFYTISYVQVNIQT
jgi:hypothetical protein